MDAKEYLSMVNLNIRINVKFMMRLASFRVYPLFLLFTTKNVKGASMGVNGISLNYTFLLYRLCSLCLVYDTSELKL